MTGAAFFDTNIFLYAGSGAAADAVKKARATELLLTTPFVLSAQVLQEFIANALGKKALGFTEGNIRATLEALRDVEVLPVTRELVEAALTLRRRFKISYWDAAILAAAQKLGCDILYTEDLNHGQDYDGVRVVNPFR
jgi:predicted nucleic acid-binding protein